MGLPPLCADKSGDDEVQDLLGEGNDDAASKGQEAVGTLGRVMGLQRQTDLNNAPAQQNEADCTDQPEDKGGQVIDHGERVAGCGKGRNGQPQQERQRQDGCGVAAEASLDLLGHGQLIGVLLFLVALDDVLHLFRPPCY